MKENEFNRIMNQYKDNLFAIAFQYFKNSQDADDIVQEVFIRFIKNKKTFENDAHIKHWLIRVTINECKRVLISPWRNRTVGLEEYAMSLPFEQKEESDLFLAVMELPKKYRIVVHLYYYEEYSIKEIAAMIGLKETTISTQLMRARKLLQVNLKGV